MRTVSGGCETGESTQKKSRDKDCPYVTWGAKEGKDGAGKGRRESRPPGSCCYGTGSGGHPPRLSGSLKVWKEWSRYEIETALSRSGENGL